VAENAAVACVATNPDVAVSSPSPFQDCRDVVYLSLFFDGTGNNLEKDTESSSWSNVGCMCDATLQDDAKSTYAIYIAGVGTRYNGKATGWLAGSTRLDQHMGRRQARWPVRLGGDRRLRQGDDSVNDRLKDVLIANSQATSRELATYAARATEKGFTKESDVLSQHRLIRIITMSLSGFSRGAALSRAFSNRVIGQCDNKHGDDPYFHSYRLHLQFMGVFDIVASFGVPSTNARRPFQERDLIVSLRCAT
jgi:hypothetical protein